ncbi:GNAT family N-acetyltransferase [Paenibacillus protaetiae]|uniref:GNAT family N-acetyltransferase n=1 Tax=Paenibacillus protaetiae TaxID=2509456 RepID=A0A4P6ETX7_9BACL|nr:GNAT family N-acetyltransferase [Paenibacillus protaetiae]QAY65915.1 GNAT family N-acetyltransferase [Paenibacillus protaetiae]
MQLVYKTNEPLQASDVVELFKSSGIKRPVDQPERIQKMLDHADLTISAWLGDKLVGIARAITDFHYCCYLSDLAVSAEYQKSGIGKALINRVKEVIGEEVALILLSAPTAMDYYPKVGFSKIENGFVIKRAR